MAYTPFTDPIDHIANLSDRPNDTDGMTAQALKAAFDQGFADAQEYINDTLIPQLNAEQARLDQAIADIESIEAGELTEGSVQTVNIADLAVTAAKIADLAITAAKLADLSVTTAKLAAGAVTEGKIAGRAVTSDKLALSSVTSENIGQGAVKAANIDDGAVTTVKLDDGAVTYAKTSGIQKKHSYLNYTSALTVGGWVDKKQTITVGIVTANCLALVSPWVEDSSSGRTNWIRCRDNGVRCVAQGNGTLTFECETVPNDRVWFSVAVFE